jgi:hypothetical protein
MKFAVAGFGLLFGCSVAFGQEQSDRRFEKLMEQSRKGYESESASPPVSEKTYTFQQIENQKTKLKDKVVKVEILKLLGEPSDLMGNGTLRFIAKDTSNGATPYGQIVFTKDGFEKVGRDGPFTVYVRVHVFTEQKSAAAVSIALGTKVSMENGKGIYSW